MPFRTKASLACRFLFASLFLPTVISSAQAQREEETVSIHFSALSWEGTIRDLLYFDRGQPTPLFIPNGSPGQPLSYQGPSTLDFCTERTGPEGETLYDRKARVTVPASARQMMLIFFPTSSGSEAYKILPLETTDAEFGANAFNFYNLTKGPIAVRLGEETFQLAPGSNKVITLPNNDNRNVNVQMAANSADKDWKLIYQSRWASPQKRRAWVFIYGEPGSTPSIRKYYQLANRANTSN